jgi:hypothetical protein
MHNDRAGSKTSRGFAFGGPVAWSIDGADPGVGIDEAGACVSSGTTLFFSTFIFACFVMIFGFDYAPYVSWLAYPTEAILFALFVWALANRTRKVLLQPDLYPRRLALEGSIGYALLLALAIAYGAAFVRSSSWVGADGGRMMGVTATNISLIPAWMTLACFHFAATEEVGARAQSIVRKQFLAGYIKNGRMGPEMSEGDLRRFTRNVYLGLVAVAAAVFALLALWAHALGWI